MVKKATASRSVPAAAAAVRRAQGQRGAAPQGVHEAAAQHEREDLGAIGAGERAERGGDRGGDADRAEPAAGEADGPGDERGGAAHLLQEQEAARDGVGAEQVAEVFAAPEEAPPASRDHEPHVPRDAGQADEREDRDRQPGRRYPTTPGAQERLRSRGRLRSRTGAAPGETLAGDAAGHQRGDRAGDQPGDLRRQRGVVDQIEREEAERAGPRGDDDRRRCPDVPGQAARHDRRGGRGREEQQRGDHRPSAIERGVRRAVPTPRAGRRGRRPGRAPPAAPPCRRPAIASARCSGAGASTRAATQRAGEGGRADAEDTQHVAGAGPAQPFAPGDPCRLRRRGHGDHHREGRDGVFARAGQSGRDDAGGVAHRRGDRFRARPSSARPIALATAPIASTAWKISSTWTSVATSPSSGRVPSHSARSGRDQEPRAGGAADDHQRDQRHGPRVQRGEAARPFRHGLRLGLRRPVPRARRWRRGAAPSPRASPDRRRRSRRRRSARR